MAAMLNANSEGMVDPVSDTSPISWYKSSFSMSNGDCVEIAQLPSGQVAVRDSKNTGPMLTFSRPDWRSFVIQLKNL
jgi:hypothetical protein